ncbi:MAG: sulfotransferase [Pseudomonadota bacterium]
MNSSTPITPNLFVLGAGRCGTTTLYDLLKKHPDIHAPAIKEPSFFCSHFQVVDNPVSYFSLFQSDKKYRLDCSHVYMSNPETPTILAQLFPNARFIITLRDPMQRALSLYSWVRAPRKDSDPFESISNFFDALSAEEERFRSEEFFKNCPHYFWNFMYMRSSLYDVQIARYFELFARSRFLFVSLSDIRNTPSSVTEKIADFLDINPDAFGENPVQHKNKRQRHEDLGERETQLMEDFFGDLTHRVDRLIGTPLDWSM